MLVLTRKVGQEIIIGDTIRITVTQIKGDHVRIGIDAPDEVPVDRQEVHERRREFAELAGIQDTEANAHPRVVVHPHA
jgi:carbon storage regulator